MKGVTPEITAAVIIGFLASSSGLAGLQNFMSSTLGFSQSAQGSQVLQGFAEKANPACSSTERIETYTHDSDVTLEFENSNTITTTESEDKNLRLDCPVTNEDPSSLQIRSGYTYEIIATPEGFKVEQISETN